MEENETVNNYETIPNDAPVDKNKYSSLKPLIYQNEEEDDEKQIASYTHYRL